VPPQTQPKEILITIFRALLPNDFAGGLEDQWFLNIMRKSHRVVTQGKTGGGTQLAALL
jgi:hypothetical protein